MLDGAIANSLSVTWTPAAGSADRLVVGMRRDHEREEPKHHRDQGERDTGGADDLAVLTLEESHQPTGTG